jgi:hypothetical protein
MVPILAHSMLRRNVGSGESLGYSAWTNETSVPMRLRLGRKPGGKARM